MTDVKKVDPYHSEYDGFYRMKSHDEIENALKRWFHNFVVNQYEFFANDYEWVVVKTIPAYAKRIKSRQICEIGDDLNGVKRRVQMDHTAPPAPVVFFAAKRKYEPPPPRRPPVTVRSYYDEFEYSVQQMRMVDMGDYVPRSRSVFGFIGTPLHNFPSFAGIDVGRKPSQSATIKVTPPAPKHRRNV